MFRAPGSSDPPSTPGSRRFGGDEPTTTPAGPPPTSFTNNSFTPHGEPPSQFFNSSAMPTSTTNKFSFNPTNAANKDLPKGSGLFSGLSGANGAVDFKSKTKFTGFGTLPKSSPPRPVVGEDDDDDDDDYSDQDDEDENEQDDEDGNGAEEEQDAQGEEDDDVMDHDGLDMSDTGGNALDAAPLKSSLFQTMTSHSRNTGLDQSLRGSAFMPDKSLSGRSHTSTNFSSVAKGLAAASEAVSLLESDWAIVATEQAVDGIYKTALADEVQEASRHLLEKQSLLLERWRDEVGAQPPEKRMSARMLEGEPGFETAECLASLLLNFHNPPEPEYIKSGRTSLAARTPAATPIPRVLLDWLNTYNIESLYSFTDPVLEQGSQYSAHENFWDAAYSSILRGKFDDTLSLLEGADFSVAKCALKDGEKRPGYHGRQLESIDTVLGWTLQLLKGCPAIRHDDWDIRGSDWALFRHRVRKAIDELKEFAEGDISRHNRPQSFQADHFASSTLSNDFRLSTAARRAESKVPWTVYEGLNDIYELLLGNEDQIARLSMDWIEACVLLAVWWNGHDDESGKQKLAASRFSFQTGRSTLVDLPGPAAYQQRLVYAIKRIQDDDQLDMDKVKTTSGVEVAFACFFDDKIEGVMDLLSCWSMPISASVVTIGTIGGWIPERTTSKNGMMDGFDQSDLMVLSYAQDSKPKSKGDEVLRQYASLLFERPEFRIDNHVVDGWELAIRVTGRMSDTRAANDGINTLLNEIDLASTPQVDHVLNLCHGLGFVNQAESVAEKHADSLSETSTDYGDALYYYALAHKAAKLRDVLNILISTSLVQSRAYPPRSTLDERMRSLVDSPRQTLNQVASVDLDAAKLLSTYLSGYATLRTFYELRDAEVDLPKGEKPRLRSLARSREAVKALISLISSAADSIRGGLLDVGIDSAVQVDGLLVLLGEVLPFVNQQKRLLSTRDLTLLLRCTEDLCTAPSSVFGQCEDVLSAALENACTGTGLDVSQMLKKSISNLSKSTNSFDMIRHSSAESSAVLVKASQSQDDSSNARRAWDWRKGVRQNTSADEIVLMVRVLLAQEIGKAWIQ